MKMAVWGLILSSSPSSVTVRNVGQLLANGQPEAVFRTIELVSSTTYLLNILNLHSCWNVLHQSDTRNDLQNSLQ